MMLESNSDFIVAHRSQYGEDMRAVNGEAGIGVYSHLPNLNMRKYYSQNGETTYKLHINRTGLIDLTSPNNQKSLINYANEHVNKLSKEIVGYIKPKITTTNIHRFGNIIQSYIRDNHPTSHSYILNHKGTGIPSGKQIITHDISGIMHMEKLK